MATNEQIAKAFVQEYLDRAPEFLDVVEFADENSPDSDEDEDVRYGEVYDLVVAELGDHAQRYADKDN